LGAEEKKNATSSGRKMRRENAEYVEKHKKP